MYCIKCGKKNIPGFKFCYSCGAPLVSPEEDTTLNPETGQIAPPQPEETDKVTAASNSTQSQPNNPPPAPPYWPPSPGQQYGPPPSPGQYSPPGQYGAPSNPSDPNWRPPFPYGYPPLPRRNEAQQFPAAPNGKPYVVIDHPEAFHAYKNKEGNQVYAPYATLQARMLAAIIDTIILLIPLQFISLFAVVFFNPDLWRRSATVSGQLDREQLSRDISAATPGWLSLLLITIYLIYCILMTWRAGGQTIGKKILRIKVIKPDGTVPDFNTALTRNLFGYSLGLGFLFPVYAGTFGSFLGFALQLLVLVGYTAAFFHPAKRGWHDRLADTLVVGKTELVKGVNY